MDLNQPKRTRIKLIAGSNARGRPLASTTASAHLAPKRPRSIPQQAPQLRNNLHVQRYNLFQGSKYICGRQVEWNAYTYANFYTELKKYIEDMSWIGLANLSKKSYSSMIVNEFYSSILIHVD